MNFSDIELGKYLVSANRSFLYYVYEKDYHKKIIKVEVLDALRPKLKFADKFRFQEYNNFKIFEKYHKKTKKLKKMNREQLEAKLLEILTDFDLEIIDRNVGCLTKNSAINLSKQIMNLIPKTSLEQVEEFMITSNQPTNILLGEISLERRLFRHKLILEECTEYLDALTFDERVDALMDLQYVLDGAMIEEGIKDKKDELFAEVHRSNMSKFDTTEEDAVATQVKYESEGIETYYILLNDIYVTFRKSDDKVLKSITYSKPNLKQFLK